MDIPYTVTARKDTGLYNAKVGIWLFLASEVMLFGGLFSGYVFLRVYADFPWPERALPVVPGLINTFILIASSVTVVFAWAALKMRKWRQFQVYMVITLICAALFMVLKAVEYNAKWTHQAVRMNDFTVLEGHAHKFTIDGSGKIKHYHPGGHDDGHASNQFEENGMFLVADKEDDHGKSSGGGSKTEHYFNQVVFEADKITVDLERFYAPIISDLMEQAQKQGREIRLSKSVAGRPDAQVAETILAEEGDLLSLGLLKKLQGIHLDAKANNASVRTKQNREAWAKLRGGLSRKERNEPSYKIKDRLELDPKFDEFLVETSSSVTFTIEPKVTFVLKPQKVKEGPTSASFKDGTLLGGKLDEKHSQIEMAADAIDFRFVAQRAEEKGIDPELAIQNTWLMKNNETVRELWEVHNKHIAELEEKLAKKGKEPTDTERYRMGWQELVNIGEGKEVMDAFSGFAGPVHAIGEAKKSHYSRHFPEVVVPREEVNLESKFTPRWNNYYAIYFLITALHGLHVIGGIIVLGYFLFFGKKMYLNNPERLANRVEVCGLFWHFVDLVWIFLFPILYLM